MALLPVKLVLTEKGVGSPKKHKLCAELGLVIDGQEAAVQLKVAGPKQVPTPPIGVIVIWTLSPGDNPET